VQRKLNLERPNDVQELERAAARRE
jgi:hypothetical protein